MLGNQRHESNSQQLARAAGAVPKSVGPTTLTIMTDTDTPTKDMYNVNISCYTPVN